RYIAYWTEATNIAIGASTYTRNIFLYDRQDASNTLVSHAGGNLSQESNGDSDYPAISRDGNFIVFESAANTLVPGVDSNNQNDVFLYARSSGALTLVSHQFGSPTTAGNARSLTQISAADFVVSSDGRFVAYYSYASDLINNFVDNNGDNEDVFLFDRLT